MHETGTSTALLSDDPLRDEIRKRVSARKYDLWFRSARLMTTDDATANVAVGNAFQAAWIRSHYDEIVREAVQAVTGRELDVAYQVDSQEESSGDSAKESASEGAAPAAAPASASDPGEPARPRSVADDNRSFFHSHSDVALNDKYSFDSFIVGPSNRLAHAAALAVADAPAGSYNPLFLHGNVGLGKTHLLQAICHKALSAERPLRVLYLSSETFVNQFIRAVEKGDLPRFRYTYRNVDILLIDDIHLLAHKERTQEEFFHTFNTLYNDQKQIVLSSDSPPSEIPSLRERLVSRFEWGLVAEIDPPGFETRQAILRAKAADRGVELPEDVLAYLAENIDRNIRELEGAVTKVVGYSELVDQVIDIDLARKALGHAAPSSLQPMTAFDRIIDVVCKQFDVRESDLYGRRRTQSIAHPRQVAMWLARQLTRLSLEEIGGRFGGRDHSTVLYAVRKVESQHEKDDASRQLLDDLVARCRQ